jgi:hypothetical protein
MRAATSGAAILATTLLCAGAAADESDSKSNKSGDHNGFIVGFSVGFGATYPCDTCPSFAGSFYVGARTNRNVAILADIGVVGGDFDRSLEDVGTERGLGLATFTLGARVWPADHFWLMGGVGIGVPFDSDWDEDWDPDHHRDGQSYDPSWAGVVSAGYEITRKGRFVLDVQARGAFAEGHQSVALGIGFNW